MRKTVREWLEELPEPYRTQAIENTRKVNRKEADILNEDDDSIHSALTGAFAWNYSPEGFIYWDKLHATLFNQIQIN